VRQNVADVNLVHLAEKLTDVISLIGVKLKNSETVSVEKCVKTEVDAGKFMTRRKSDSVSQLFSFRYLQKGRLQIDAQPADKLILSRAQWGLNDKCLKSYS
jgi:hypothetical protein